LYYVERLDKGAFTGFSNHIRAKLSAARPRGDNVAHTRSLLDCRHSNIIDTYAISPLTVVAIQGIQPTAAESFPPSMGFWRAWTRATAKCRIVDLRRHFFTFPPPYMPVEWFTKTCDYSYYPCSYQQCVPDRAPFGAVVDDRDNDIT
jgi:hypothetical protein